MSGTWTRRAFLAGTGTVATTGLASGATSTPGSTPTADTPTVGGSPYEIEWEVTYSASGELSEVDDLLVLDDGYAILVTRGDYPDTRPGLVRAGPEGEVRWQQTFDDLSKRTPTDAVVTDRGAILLATTNTSGGRERGPLVAKVTSGGDLAWITPMRGSHAPLSSLVTLGGGSYAWLGSRSPEDETPILEPISRDGTRGRPIPIDIDAPNPYLTAATPVEGGGFVAVGRTHRGEDDPGRVVVVEVTSEGEVRWETIVEAGAHPHPSGVAVTENAVFVGARNLSRGFEAPVAITAFLGALDRGGSERWRRWIARPNWGVNDIAPAGADRAVGVGFGGGGGVEGCWLFELDATDGIVTSGELKTGNAAIAPADEGFTIAGEAFGSDGKASLAAVTETGTGISLPGFGAVAAGAGITGVALLGWLREHRGHTTK